jgi:riboflavin synthase
MFTGLIEEVGTVAAVGRRFGKTRLRIAAQRVTGELKPGDSVSVSGVCLTAVEVDTNSFSADLAAETVARTSLSRLRPGALVNLELPARAGARLGGHIVQGHVDGVATLETLEPVNGGKDYWLQVRVAGGLQRYVVEKGSIAIEGISLTVASVEGARITVAIIPHTCQATNLASLTPGDALNIEVDVLAKYAEKLLQEESAHRRSAGITLERLLREGF